MRVLVLFERSGVVREAFRRLGHDAWSADAEPAEDGSPYHSSVTIRFDSEIDIGDQVNDAIGADLPWNMVIAHPDCTHLSVSGAHRFAEKRADGRQQKAIQAFMWTTKIRAEYLCVENPVCIMSTLWRKPDQIIQPYQFGDDASKKTCLWLRNLPKLDIDPALYIPPRIVDGKSRWANQTDSGQNRLGPSGHRAIGPWTGQGHIQA